MKALYFFILSFFFAIGTNAQNICDLNNDGEVMHVNNIRAVIHNKGDNFEMGGYAGFQVPYEDEETPSSIYATGLLFTAFDAGKNLKIKVLLNKSNDCGYLPGPWFEGEPQQQYEFSGKWNKIFKVTGQEIMAHIEDSQDGAIDNPLPAIFAWPGKGNRFFKEINGFELFDDTRAGFYEVPGHENGIYEPDLGEYPMVTGLDPESIPGAIYWSVYRTGTSKQEYKLEHIKMQLQIQQVTWAMATDDKILSNTLFTRYYVKNKNSGSYYNFRFGLYVDFDLGCYLDDYIGSMPELSSFYVYNMDNLDESCGTRIKVNGYGENPPVQVATFLGENKLDGFYTMGKEVIDMNEGHIWYNKFFKILNGKWPDNVPYTYGGTGYNEGSTDTVDYLFPDDPSDPDGWSMYQENMPGKDWRVFAINRKKQVPDFVFNPEDEEEYTIAYTFYRKDGEDHLGNVKFAKSQIPLLHEMYSRGLAGAGISKNHSIFLDKAKIFPNPVAQGIEAQMVILDKNQNQYRIYNTLGKVVANGYLVKGKNYLKTAKLSTGTYFVQIKGSETVKLLIR